MNVAFGKRENEVERIAWAIGTIEGEEVHEVVKLPRSFSWSELADELSYHVWWLTPEEVREKLFV